MKSLEQGLRKSVSKRGMVGAVLGATALITSGAVVGMSAPRGEGSNPSASYGSPAICRDGSFSPYTVDYYRSEILAAGNAEVIYKDGKPTEIKLNSPFITRMETTESEGTLFVIVSGSNSSNIPAFTEIGIRIDQDTFIKVVNIPDGTGNSLVTNVGFGIGDFQQNGGGVAQYLGEIDIPLSGDLLPEMLADNQTALSTLDNNAANSCNDTVVFDPASVTLYKP